MRRSLEISMGTNKVEQTQAATVRNEWHRTAFPNHKSRRASRGDLASLGIKVTYVAKES